MAILKRLRAWWRRPSEQAIALEAVKRMLVQQIQAADDPEAFSHQLGRQLHDAAYGPGGPASNRVTVAQVEAILATIEEAGKAGVFRNHAKAMLGQWAQVKQDELGPLYTRGMNPADLPAVLQDQLMGFRKPFTMAGQEEVLLGPPDHSDDMFGACVDAVVDQVPDLVADIIDGAFGDGGL